MACMAAGADPMARLPRRYIGWTPLHRAAAFNKNPAVTEALLQAGADVNVRDEEGNPPLDVAAAVWWNTNPAAIEALLKAGANPMAENSEGWTPWDLVENNGALRGTEADWRLNDERFKSPE